MKLARLLTAALLVTGCAGQAPSAPPKPPPPPPTAPAIVDDTPPPPSLDDRAAPTRGELEVELDPAAEGFSGRVALEINLKRPARIVWLHARDLQIASAAITAAGKRRAATTRTADGELLGLAVDETLPAGPARVEIAYQGRFGETVGVVRTKTTPPFVYSDFEPSDARAAFPCFDEPRFKTPWKITAVVPSGVGAFGNYPEAGSSARPDGRREVRFAETRPLSTYQVAFVAGALEAVPVPGAPVPTRILVQPGLGPRAAPILGDIAALLASASAYVDEPVPYPKLDFLARPDDGTQTGGMENPGLITLREGMLVFDLHAGAEAGKRAHVAAVNAIAHEIGHLWVGDLVTLDAWRDLWVNEGIDTWFGIKLAAARLGPAPAAFSMSDLFSEELRGERAPIRGAEGEPAQKMFRVSSYVGGAALMSTLETWLGPERTKKAIGRLIDAHRDGTIRAADVVSALGAAGDRDQAARLPAVVDALLDARRSPVVTVGRRCGLPGAMIAVDVEPRAPLPVCMAIEGEASPRCVVVEGHADLPLGRCPRWVLPGPGGFALYQRRFRPGELAAVVREARLDPQDERALARAAFDELRDTTALDAPVLAFMATGDVVSPMIGGSAARRLEEIERAAPDDKARRDLLGAVAEVAARRGFALKTAEGRFGWGADLAAWLIRRGDPAAIAAATRAVPDPEQEGLDPWIARLGLLADAKSEDAARRARVTRIATGKTPLRTEALIALTAAPPAEAQPVLERELAAPKANRMVSFWVVNELARMPDRAALYASALGRAAAIDAPMRVDLAGLGCDPAAFDAAMAKLHVRKEEIDRVRPAVAACAALRARWAKP